MALADSGERTLVTADGTVVCPRCRIAKDPWTRMRGLLGRRQLDDGEGILLRPASSVHTWFMLFPIDVVFLDRDLSGAARGAECSVRGVPSRAAGRRLCSSSPPASAKPAVSESAIASTG